MKNLQLSLIRIWFEMTKAGIKPEDYRNITPYWCSRFILVDGEKMPQKWWDKWVKSYKNETKQDEYFDFLQRYFAQTEEKRSSFSFKQFTQNTMTLGYPKKGDAERTLILEHKGIEIRTGNPEWGAEPGKIYFVIKHGNKLS